MPAKRNVRNVSNISVYLNKMYTDQTIYTFKKSLFAIFLRKLWRELINGTHHKMITAEAACGNIARENDDVH